MPPATPSRTRGRVPSTSPRPGRRARALLGALGVLEEAGLDLAHGDGQRLLARARLDERADVLEQALAELRVVVVDLPGPLGGVDHQRVLRRDLVEQVVDRRVGDALGEGAGEGRGEVGVGGGGGGGGGGGEQYIQEKTNRKGGGGRARGGGGGFFPGEQRR